MVFMSFATAQTIKQWLTHGIAVALFVALLISLWMVADALQNSVRFEHLYSALLLVNAIAFLALLAFILLNLQELVYQVKTRQAGARLTVRLVGLLVLLSTLPVIILYYFSIEFLHQRLDTWVDVKTEEALTDALEIHRATLDANLREALQETKAIAAEIAPLKKDLIEWRLTQILSRSNAAELTLLTPNGQIITASAAEPGRLLPNRPNDSILLQLKQADTYISLEPLGVRGLHIRAIVKLMLGTQVLLLQALFPMTERTSQLANRIEIAFVNYKQRAYLRKHLKLNLTLVLSLVLLHTLASVVWLAFLAARRFVAPLSQLAEGTQAVARGNYDQQLPVTRFDELGFLVQSFNDMTRKIAQARDEVKQSQQLADNHRTYLEAVLQRLSSGVISLDYEQRLRTANPAANQILGIPLSDLLGQTLSQLQHDHPNLKTLCHAIHPHLVDNAQDWREEITLLSTSGRKILICRGTPLQLSSLWRHQGGYVIVFEDVTTLIQAQREAAWSEVARRLAHEIKNPLTPIQLSAERLRQKYLRKLPLPDAETLDRLTETIIQQVETMKEMVNAFSEYAKTPTMQWRKVNLNELVEEVIELYHHPTVHLNLLLSEEIPLIEADCGRLRQVLHNLLKNALEAQVTDNCITVTTRAVTEETWKGVELSIADQGPGVPLQLLDKIFEPYVTTKPKGTGLGLAIVKKIIDEHGGIVWIENRPGACVMIRLPVVL
jgi:nitrogen fixation/metabolism regulation signal transduction histidine kinase